MMPIMGVCTFDEAYKNAMGSTVFFLMGTFAFTVALDATTLPTRIAAFVLKWSGTNTNKMLLGFMCATAFLSFSCPTWPHAACSFPLASACSS